ncbi:MAG: DNA gyrase inhibitor YacG [Silvibacterium sp.]
MSPNLVLRCPTCRALVAKDDEYFPFCSDRCRLIDLGKWASGEYRISSPILDPEVLEGLNEESRRPRNDSDDDPNAR